MDTPNLDKMLRDAAGGTSIFTLEKEVPAALKEFSAWKADMESRLTALEGPSNVVGGRHPGSTGSGD
jgi:hypothetical protein